MNPTPSDSNDWIPLAQIGRPHGLDGGFFLKSPDRKTQWPGYKKLLLQKSNKETMLVNVKKSILSGGQLVIYLNEFLSRSQIEELYNTPLFVHRTEISFTKEDYLVNDLIGAKVVSENQTEIGKVTAIISFGAQENLEILIPGKPKTVLFPFIEKYISNIDLEKKTIEIKYQKEFFED